MVNPSDGIVLLHCINVLMHVGLIKLLYITQFCIYAYNNKMIPCLIGCGAGIYKSVADMGSLLENNMHF